MINAKISCENICIVVCNVNEMVLDLYMLTVL